MKYIVLKTDDVNRYLDKNSLAELAIICANISLQRTIEGKADNQYFVVNTDEPYADKVKALIEEHEGEEVTFGQK
jgi:hypothetical protein